MDNVEKYKACLACGSIVVRISKMAGNASASKMSSLAEIFV